MSQPDFHSRREERPIVFITSIAHLLCHLSELLFTGVMLAVKQEFDLRPDQLTALALLGYVLMGLGAFPVGVWVDAWGTSRVMRAFFLITAVAGLAVALSTTAWQLAAALTLLGIAASIYHPVGLAMISLGVSPANRGRALGINGVGGSIGQALGPALGLFAASLGHWRLAYVSLAALALAGLVLLLVAQRGVVGELRPALPRHHEDPLPIRDNPWHRYGPLVFLLLATTLGGFNYRFLVTGLPPFLAGQAPGASGQLRVGTQVFVVLLAGGLGQFLGGWAADRYGARSYPVFIGVMAGAALALVGLEGSPLAVVAAGVLALCLFAQQPVENFLLAAWTTRGRRGLSYAAKFTFTFGVGALGTQVVGLIWTEYNWLGPVFYLLAGNAALMYLLFLVAVAFRDRGEQVDLVVSRPYPEGQEMSAPETHDDHWPPPGGRERSPA